MVPWCRGTSRACRVIRSAAKHLRFWAAPPDASACSLCMTRRGAMVSWHVSCVPCHSERSEASEVLGCAPRCFGLWPLHDTARRRGVVSRLSCMSCHAERSEASEVLGYALRCFAALCMTRCGGVAATRRCWCDHQQQTPEGASKRTPSPTAAKEIRTSLTLGFEDSATVADHFYLP